MGSWRAKDSALILSWKSRDYWENWPKCRYWRKNRSHVIQPIIGTCVNRNLCYTGVMKGPSLSLLLYMDMSAPIFNSYRWDGISVWSFESLVKSFSLGGVGEIIRHFFPPGYRYPYSISCFTISLTNHVHFFECINKSNYLKPEEQANTISMTWCKVHFKIKWILRKPHPFPNPPFKESK